MRIGITGHQKLDTVDAWSWVEQVMENELDQLPPPLIGITSLAIGADQLLAELVLKRGGRIHAVLPFADIERTFQPTGLTAFRRLLASSSIEILEPSATDEESFLAAGKRVVQLCDTLLAVWDGLPARGIGGTADIFDYGRAQRIPLIHINPKSRTVVEYFGISG